MLKLCSRKRGKFDVFRTALIDDARQFAGVLPNRSRSGLVLPITYSSHPRVETSAIPTLARSIY